MPGSLPAQFVMESMMEHVAKALNKDPSAVRKINFYTKGQVLISGIVGHNSCHGPFGAVFFQYLAFEEQSFLKGSKNI